MPFINKTRRVGSRKPGRHVAAAGHLHDVVRMFFDIIKRQQAEWRGFTRAMTAGAVLKDDGSNIMVESQLTWRTWNKRFFPFQLFLMSSHPAVGGECDR